MISSTHFHAQPHQIWNCHYTHLLKKNEVKIYVFCAKEMWMIASNIKYPNWFEAIAMRVPSTNNAFESFNRVIKDEQTLRDRLELKVFRIKAFEMVKQWSVEYDAVLKIFNDRPKIDLFLWTMAYEWSIANIKPTIKQQRTSTVYRIPTSEGILFRK